MKNVPPTPFETLIRCRDIALGEGLHYVYTGNVPGIEGEHTYCPRCHKIVVARHGFHVESVDLKNGHCAFCGQAIPGIWS